MRRGGLVSCPDDEYTRFYERVLGRARKSGRWLERNRWVEPVSVVRVRRYDEETDRLLASIRVGEREAS